MTVSVQINGTALNPQPRDVAWEITTEGAKLNGTDHVGAYDILILRSPPARGGTANWNWTSFENQVLTSVTVPLRGQSMKTGTETTYSSGVVSKPITPVNSTPGDIIDAVEFRVQVIT